MDPRSRTPPDDYLSGADAAALLGVKRETLYAYASRGLVSSVPGPSGRARRYARVDLEALRARAGARSGHAAVAAGALQWGEPVLESAISRIDAAGPSYRGHSAADLAVRGVRFEAVAELLWTGALPEGEPRWEVRGLGVAPSKLAALLPAARRPSPRSPSLSRPSVSPTPRASMCASPRSSRAPACSCVASRRPWLSRRGPRAWRPPSKRPRWPSRCCSRSGVDAAKPPSPPSARALVVCADHELPVSTFAARVVASSGGGSLRLPRRRSRGAVRAGARGREHAGGGAAARGGAARARPRRAARAHAPRRADPGLRTPPLSRRGSAPAAAPRGRATGLPRAPRPAHSPRCGGRHDRAPSCPATLDIGLVAVAEALGLPAGSALAFFALGRLAGWVAHVLEQRRAGVLLRPRARYVGS
jgi:citrate synthase